jgi:hypothetical protein
MTIGTLSFTERSDSLFSSAVLFRETRRTGPSGLRYWRDRELYAKLLDTLDEVSLSMARQDKIKIHQFRSSSAVADAATNCMFFGALPTGSV